MKRTVLISIFTLIIIGIIIFEEDRINSIKATYAYSGKMLERAIVYDYIQNDKIDLLRKYVNTLIKNDIELMKEKKVIDSLVEIGYCKQFENIKNILNATEKQIKQIEKLCR